MKKLLREPLLHFLLIGILLFIFWSIRGDESEIDRGRIIVDTSQVNRIKDAWSAQWKRSPTPSELKNLIQEWKRYYMEKYSKDESGRYLPAETVQKKVKEKLVYSRPSLSPDGKYITYVTNEMGRHKLYLQNLLTGKKKCLYRGGYQLDEKTRTVRASEKPGLGIEIDEKEVAKHPYKEELLQRVFYSDGSVGDW